MNLVNGIIRIVYYSIIYTALSSRREKGFVNPITGRRSLRLKERERREENDILSFGSIAFRENGCFPDHTSACFFRDLFHRFHGAAGADDIIDKEDLPAADEIDIVLRKVEALLAHGRDGFILDADRILI